MSGIIENTVGNSGLRVMRRLIFFTASVYCGVVVMMWLLENSFVYPAPKYPIGYWEPKPDNVEEADFVAADGTRLHGWFVDHERPRGTLLYFHGNGENISFLEPLLQTLNGQYGLQVMVFDYRGYGKSEGRPSERGIYLDSRAALRWLNERTNTTPADIILQGRSIGGAVAVELAASEGCQALILENTFTSMPEVAAFHFPWLPVRLMMSNRYPSVERIGQCPQPLLQSHGKADAVVPFELGQALFEASPSENKRFLEFNDMDHNDPTPQKFWNAFGELLDELAEKNL